MEKRSATQSDERASALALSESAKHLDAQADAFWLLAGDCDRWGLDRDAQAARRRACDLRVLALTKRAGAARRDARPANTGGARR